MRIPDHIPTYKYTFAAFFSPFVFTFKLCCRSAEKIKKKAREKPITTLGAWLSKPYLKAAVIQAERVRITK